MSTFADRLLVLGAALLTAGVGVMQAASFPSPKKGIGGGLPTNETAQALAYLHVSWYYDWGPRPQHTAPAGVQFVPMIWGLRQLNDEDLAAAKATGTGILLGFNEPNAESQANMTVQQALDAWPKLEALNMRLGSPAPGSGSGDDVNPNGWLAQFMAGAKARGYRVDFICIHPYQPSFDPDQATRDLIKEVNTVHNMYHLPIWVTEYSIVNWHGHPKMPDAAVEAKFATESANALQKVPFVERYAWYAGRNIPDATYNIDGTPTVVGKAWSAAPR